MRRALTAAYHAALHPLTNTMDYGGNYGNYGDGGFSTDADYNGGGGDDSQRQQQTRNTLSPVTIKQINDSAQHVPDGEFSINNVSLNMVSFVGVVRRVDNQTSAVTVSIEDGTGSVDVKKWIDDKLTSAAEESEAYSAMINKYVYVTGALKEFNQKKAIQHAVIREITDHNEVLYHMLYTVANHLEAEGLLKVAKSDPQSSLFVLENTAGSGSSDLLDRILAIIASNSSSMLEGVPVTWISESLGLPVGTVQEKCQYLSEQGRIYQGYDDGAYLCA